MNQVGSPGWLTRLDIGSHRGVIPHPTKNNKNTKTNSGRSLYSIYFSPQIFCQENVLKIDTTTLLPKRNKMSTFSGNKLRWSNNNLPPHTILNKFGTSGFRTDYFEYGIGR